METLYVVQILTEEKRLFGVWRDYSSGYEDLVDAKKDLEYDAVLEKLYNFGDYDHRIWIKTA